jgi:hypothetical protein
MTSLLDADPKDKKPSVPMPPLSLISTGIGADGISLYLGNADGARDVVTLASVPSAMRRSGPTRSA